jgi:general secretion pathway protein I
LLEVIVATAIAALALIALFNLSGDGLMASETATNTEEAIERARSHLAALSHDSDLSEGEYEGEDGGGFRWRISVHPVEISQNKKTGFTQQLLAVEVTISWGWRHGGRAVTLKSLCLRTST